MCEKNTTSTWRGLACTFNFYQTGHLRNFKCLCFSSPKQNQRISHFHKTTKTHPFFQHTCGVCWLRNRLSQNSIAIVCHHNATHRIQPRNQWARGPFSHGDGCEAPTSLSAFMAWIAMRAWSLIINLLGVDDSGDALWETYIVKFSQIALFFKFHQTFRYLKWRYSPMQAVCKAYVRDSPPPNSPKRFSTAILGPWNSWWTCVSPT